MMTMIALLATVSDAQAQVPVGASLGLYEVTNNSNTTIGWYVVVGGSSVTAYGYTWQADTAYWFWDSGSPFPSGFRLYYDSGSAPNRDPAGANSHLTTGPFNLSGTHTPASVGAWWSITRYIDGTTPDSLGYVRNYQDDQYWWEFDADDYLAIDSDDYLQFTGTSAPGTAMYGVIDAGL